MKHEPDLLELQVLSIQQEAAHVISLELGSASGRALPSFSAGAHIDLLLSNGMSRSYSLINPQGEAGRYVVAVALDRNSRGGSQYVHTALSAGAVILARPPRNRFPLHEGAPHSVFIAGGIGITPILCMARRLAELGKSWQLLYCARKRSYAPFLDELEALSGPCRAIDCRFNEEPGYDAPDLGAIVADAPSGAHFYACGPSSLMEAFTCATGNVDQSRVHTEVFEPVEPVVSELGGFELRLSRSGVSLFIPQGQTILSALRGAGFNPPSACEEGTCGSCEVAVIEGVPLHRDRVLSDEDKNDNAVMMICCSGSKSPTLTIDL